jgi:hypothetical protein
MKKLLLCLMFSFLMLTLSKALYAQFVKSGRLQNASSKTNCSTIKFRALDKYEGNHWSKVFSDKQVVPVLRRILRTDYKNLISSLDQVKYPDSLSFVDTNGILILEGGVQGLYTIMEAKLIVEPCGNIYAAILDGGEKILYFSNDKNYSEKLHPTINEWRSDLEKRRKQGISKPESDLPIVFKNKSNTQ